MLAAGSGRLLARVPAGPPPQHVAFGGRDVYVTSGYGSSVEMVDAASGRVVRSAPVPYGSFNLAVAGPMSRAVAPAARSIALGRW